MGNSKDQSKLVRLVPGELEKEPAVAQMQRLAEMAEAMDADHVFSKGQFVRWKAGLKNRGIPSYNEPVVVREVLAVPIFDVCDAARCSASPVFGEPLTLVLGIVDPDGDFVELRYDGRRFEPMAT